MMDETEQPTTAIEPEVPNSLAMSGEISNKLLTRAPMTAEEIEVCLEHYLALESLLRSSGPIFVNPRRDAAKYYNMALDRLHEEETKLANAGLPPPSARLQA